MKQTTFLMCLLLLTIGVFAQTPIQHPKKYYVDGNGRLFWNRMLPFYLKIMATPGDTGVMLHSESTPQYVDPCFFDTEGKNPVRTIYAVDKTTMKTVVPQLEVLWEVYADGLAPKTVSAFIKSPYYKSPTQRYYGNGLVVPLKATDEMSGVENIYYSVNQANYAKYSDTIRLSTEGEYNLQYYSVDNVGNAEVPIKETFTVDLTTPATVYAIKGLSLGNIISGGTAFILTATDQLSGVAKTYYKIDEGKEILYDGKDILVSSLIDGEHTLSYYSIDKVDNRETVKSYTFYLDKLAPILASDVLGDRFIVNDQVYFSGRTKLKLTAVDNKAGIHDVLFSIDGEQFKSYTDPFYLPSRAGVHIIRYFAIDKMENETGGRQAVQKRFDEYTHNVSKVYVDLTGPSLFYKYTGDYFKGRDTVFVNKNTKIELSATDPESGLQFISYSIDKVQEETKYTAPFSIEAEGIHHVEFFGYDNVNNRNRNEFIFVVDNTPPEIIPTFSIKAISKLESYDVYPPYVSLFLAATDMMIGAEGIEYTLNGQPQKKYANYINGFQKDQLNTIIIKAYDKLKNQSSTELKFWIK